VSVPLCLLKGWRDLHRQGVLVVAVADVAAGVLRIGAAVHEALSIVDVPIARGAAQTLRLARIFEVEEYETGAAGIGPRGSANGNAILLLLVDHHVVGATDGEPVPVTGEVRLAIESYGLLRVDFEQLRICVSSRCQECSSVTTPILTLLKSKI